MNELDMMSYGPEREKNRKAKELLDAENIVEQEAVEVTESNESNEETVPTPEPEEKKKGKISKLKEKIGKVFEGKSEEEKDALFEQKQQKETEKKNAEINEKFLKSFPEFFPKEMVRDVSEHNTPVGKKSIAINRELPNMSKLEGLSWQQKTVLLERMQSYAVQESKLRARDMFELDKKNAQAGVGFLGKVKSIGKNIGLQFSKNAKLLAYEKQALAHIKQDEVDFDFFKNTVKERKILVNKKGDALFDYFSEVGITPTIPVAKKESFDDAKYSLDKSAYELKNIPEAWATPEAPKELQKKYNEAKNAFEQAKEKQFEQLVSVGLSEQEAGSKLAELEGRVMTDRLFASEPRIHKAFVGIEKGKVWQKYLTGYVQDNGYYMAGGGALRKGAIGAGAVAGFGAATIIAAPLISGAIGYLRGQKRTKDSLVYEAGNRRRSGTDTPSRSFEIEDDLGQKLTISRDALLYKKGEHAPAESLQKIGHTIARMKDKINTASNEGDVAFWRIQLENRLDYVREKIEKGEMVFDKGQSGLQEKMALNTLLREGATTLAISDSGLQQSLKEELAQKIDEQEERGGTIATNDFFGSVHRFKNRAEALQSNREAYRNALAQEEKNYVKEKAWESAKFGALGGLIGAGVSEWLWGQGTPDGQVVKGTVKINAEQIQEVKVPVSPNSNAIDSTYVAKNPIGNNVDTLKQVTQEIQTPKTPELISSDMLVHENDGVSSVIIRQIENNKELAMKLGFKEGEDLHAFAFNKGVELIKQEGYMNGLKEVRLTKDAIDHAAYKVEFDTDGKAVIHEYFDGKKVVGEENINKPYEELFEKKITSIKGATKNTGAIEKFYPPAIDENEIDTQASDFADNSSVTDTATTYTGPKIPRPDEATDSTIIKTIDYSQLGAIEPQFQETINHIFDSKLFGFKIQDGVQSKEWMNVAYKDTATFLTQKTNDKKLQQLAQVIIDLQKSSGISPTGYKIVDYIHLAMANKK
ncbi:MAG: hypothetical protein WCO58_02595 [bacterium]